jgi:hypothetical protein
MGIASGEMASGALHHTMSSCAQTGQDGDILRVPRPTPLHIPEADRDLLRGPKEGIFEVQAQVVSRRAECLLERLLEGAILLVHAANRHNDGAIVSYGDTAAAGDERAIRGDATGGTHLGGERRATTVRSSTYEEATGLSVRDGWRLVVGSALRKHISRDARTPSRRHALLMNRQNVVVARVDDIVVARVDDVGQSC